MVQCILVGGIILERDLFDPREGGGSGLDGASQTRIDLGAPLAERMRPRTLGEVLGQEHLIGEDRVLRRAVEEDALRPFIFWGPPGTGKTTLARIIAKTTNAHFITLSAVLHGVKELRASVDEAKRMARRKVRTILFVDEIHRFNKAQQDALLPQVEDGTVILIGATTENPSFEVITPLLSRVRVLVLESLQESHLVALLRRALADAERGLGGMGLSAEDEALRRAAMMSGGDARSALNVLEAAATLAGENRRIDAALIGEAAQRKILLYDKSGEEHYNLISALHKTMRASDPDAALYWLARMLEGGEDPMYVLRRLVRFASEDVGMADPRALSVATAAQQAFHFIGPPDGKLAIAQAVVYLAQAPKSDAVYRGFGAAERAVREREASPVPHHLRNAPTGLMRDLGYGDGYQHAHQFDDAVVEMEGMPEGLQGTRFYHPTSRGYETEVRKRLARREETWNQRMGERLHTPEEGRLDDRRPADPAMPGKRGRRRGG